MGQVILKRIASGDKSAVQDCLNAYGGLVWSLARRMSANADDAEDAVQEIFIDVWKNAARFDEAQASENIDSLDDIVTEPSNGNNQDLQICVEAKEAAQAMKNLRPEQRQILHLSIVQGFSHQEIADALKMPLGTVKTHARRGLLQVREFLGLGDSDFEKEAAV